MTDNKRSALVELLCERLCVGDEIEVEIERKETLEDVCDTSESSCDNEVIEDENNAEESESEGVSEESTFEAVALDAVETEESDGESEADDAESEGAESEETDVTETEPCSESCAGEAEVSEESSEGAVQDTDETVAEESEEGISVEFYRVEREMLTPSEELIFSYCDENGLCETRGIVERILERPDTASRDDITVLGFALGISARNVSKILTLCGLEPLRSRTLYDTVLSAVLGDSSRLFEDKKSADEYLLRFSERYCEAMAVLSEMDREFVEGAQVFAPAPNRLLSLCSENLAEYIGKKGWYFIERQRVILEKYRNLLVLFGELYDNTAINCTWNSAEAKYCLRSFIERFCAVLPKRNSYTEMTVKEIEAGHLPTRELMIILTVYELSLCGREKILYKGKGKGSKKVTRELAGSLFEEGGVTYLRPGLYFGNVGDLEITSLEQLIYRINLRLNSLGYCQLNANYRFDKVLLSMSDIEIKTKNGGRTLILSGLSEKAQSLDISEIYESVPTLLAAFVYILENSDTEGFVLGCNINEEL